MKKLLIIAVAAMAVASAKAASVDWNVAGTADQENYTVYLLTSLADSYASVSEIAAAAVDSATIVKNGRKYSTGDQTAHGDAVTAASMANAYYVIVASASATTYTSYGVNMSSLVYDPDNQETSSGSFDSVDAATIISSGTTKSYSSPVPEPTSGLLLLLGMAGLALKRKRA